MLAYDTFFRNNIMTYYCVFWTMAIEEGKKKPLYCLSYYLWIKSLILKLGDDLERNLDATRK